MWLRSRLGLLLKSIEGFLEIGFVVADVVGC